MLEPSTPAISEASKAKQGHDSTLRTPDAAGEQLEIRALPTMEDLEQLQLELDRIDKVLADLDGVRPWQSNEAAPHSSAEPSPETATSV